MKKYAFLLMAICLVAWSANAQEKKENGPVIKWEENAHDFGDMQQGDKVEHTFAFTNTGNEPLIVTNVQVTCGCTTKSYPKDPIPPGGKSEIVVGFNSTGKIGKQNKVVTVVSNALGDDNKITFTANVLQKQPQ